MNLENEIKGTDSFFESVTHHTLVNSNNIVVSKFLLVEKEKALIFSDKLFHPNTTSVRMPENEVCPSPENKFSLPLYACALPQPHT